MTIGRSNNAASDTRFKVSWNVERVPNSGRNCLGCTSREAGHSLVPAPPHITRGIIRRFIDASSFVVSRRREKNRECRLRLALCPGLETRIAQQISNVREDNSYVAGLHPQ